MNKNSKESRRTFLKTTSAGFGAGLIAQTGSASEPGPGSTKSRREIWIASITQERLEAKTGAQMVDKVLDRMRETLVNQPDIICIPETFPYNRVDEKRTAAQIAQEASEWIIPKFADFARQNHCYVICPLHTKENGVVYNSAVLIDRQGKTVGAYHKIHPTVDEIEGGAMLGPLDPPVFKTDFGTIGMQICFDANWPEGWRELRKKGAEIIFWSSAFPGGRMLNAHAWSNKTPIVTSTWGDPTRIIDITGEEIAVSGRYQHWICAPVNLEKAMIHTWPYTQHIEKLRAKYGRSLRVTRLHNEGWTIIESVSDDVDLHSALKEFGIPTHEEHIKTADQFQKQKRPA